MLNYEEYTPFTDDPTAAETPAPRRTPEERLLLCVLEEAIRNIRLYGHNRNYGVSRKKYAELAAWFLSDDDAYAFSFAAICTTFDLSKEDLRRRVFQLAGDGKCGRIY